MRYLRIHSLLWALIVLAITVIDLLVVVVIWIVYLLWYFKIYKNIWSELHEYSYRYLADYLKECENSEDSGGTDNNILETLKRRYNYFKETKNEIF